jgi:hypothetical protein
MEQITIAGVTGATAVLIQLLVLFIPVFNVWFAGLASHIKALAFVLIDFLVAAFWLAVLYFNCFALAGIACPVYEPATAVQIFLGLGSLFLVTVGIQQGAYALGRGKAAALREEAKAPAGEPVPVG